MRHSVVPACHSPEELTLQTKKKKMKKAKNEDGRTRAQ
jgi:hypothetical protein